MLFVKAFLHSVQHALVGQAFHRQHFRAIALHRQVGAGLDGLTVHVDGAGTAVAGFAADVGTG